MRSVFNQICDGGKNGIAVTIRWLERALFGIFCRLVGRAWRWIVLVALTALGLYGWKIYQTKSALHERMENHAEVVVLGQPTPSDKIILASRTASFTAYRVNLGRLEVKRGLFEFSALRSIEISSCYFLKEVKLQTQLESLSIQDAAIEELTVPEGTRQIYLDNNHALAKVEIGKGVTVLEITNCGLGEISLPSDLLYADLSYTSLKTITVPQSVAGLICGGGLHLRELKLRKGNLRKLTCQHSALTELDVPDGVEEVDISYSPFLTTLHLPASLQILRADICPQLESVELPSAVMEASLDGCRTLKRLKVSQALPDSKLKVTSKEKLEIERY